MAGARDVRGRLTHSVAYANAAPYAGQRVLVVGAGNSGAEIATDLTEHGAAYVAISIRTPPPIVPRDPFGMPVQRTSILLSALPPAIANRLGRATARHRARRSRHVRHAAGRFAPYSTRRVPLIDVGFVEALEAGTRDGAAGARAAHARPARSSLTGRASRSTRSSPRPDSPPASSRCSTCPARSTSTANRAAHQASRPRIPACTSSASRTACAATCSRRTARRAASPPTSSAICRPRPEVIRHTDSDRDRRRDGP